MLDRFECTSAVLVKLEVMWKKKKYSLTCELYPGICVYIVLICCGGEKIYCNYNASGIQQPHVSSDDGCSQTLQELSWIHKKMCCQRNCGFFLDLMRTTVLIHLSSFWASVQGREKIASLI